MGFLKKGLIKKLYSHKGKTTLEAVTLQVLVEVNRITGILMVFKNRTGHLPDTDIRSGFYYILPVRCPVIIFSIEILLVRCPVFHLQ